MIRQPFSGTMMGSGMLLLLVLAVLVASHTVFPFFPLFGLILYLFTTRMLGRAVAWRGDSHAIGMPMDGSPSLPPNGISKEKELLKVLERHEDITAARAALETSLSVAQAEEMLSGLANNGHVRISAHGGKLAYALWE